MNLFKLFLHSTFLVIISSCLNQDKSNSLSSDEKNPSPYTPAAAIIYNADVIIDPSITNQPVQSASSLFQNKPTNPRYEKISGPNWLVVDLVTGVYSVQNGGTYAPENFEIICYENGNKPNQVSTGTFTLAVNGDPLRYQQWHLNNIGQRTYAISAGSSGVDINVDPVLAAGITGKGIKIAISDSGVEINHDDLHQNVISGASRDYTLSPPYIGTPITTSAHGTAVSGIIAARGWNNIGGLGVAPLASIAGFQFLSSTQTSSILIDQASGDFNIFNYSYGDTLYYDTLSDQSYIDHLRYQTISNNKFFVKASGNEYAIGNDDNFCAPHNANFPFENESPFMIVVGAVNAEGEKAVYSNVGSNLWVSAPGGEYGDIDPAILTTDLPTCFKGYSKAANYVTNDFEYGHSENAKCNYTSTMNGTSSSAPIVSGVIALILEANPALSYRDVKHILAVTSARVDPNHNNPYGTDHPSSYFSGCNSLNLAGHNYELGWVSNNAHAVNNFLVDGDGNEFQIYFNNFYGFGLVDADAAVEMAKGNTQDPMNWLPLGAQIETNANLTAGVNVSLAIPDANKDGVAHTQNLTANLKVESVQIKVQATHPRSGEIGIELTSPGGTKSILMNINNSFYLDTDQNLNIVLTSHAFYGEDSQGNWEIRVIDGKAGNSGTLTSWSLNVLGHN
jgi:subtilisin-like proprotein convertase family protein